MVFLSVFPQTIYLSFGMSIVVDPGMCFKKIVPVILIHGVRNINRHLIEPFQMFFLQTAVSAPLDGLHLTVHTLNLLSDGGAAQAHVPVTTEFVSEKTNPLGGTQIVGVHFPQERSFGFGFPIQFPKLLTVICRILFEIVIEESVIFKRLGICFHKACAFVKVGMHQKNIVAVSNKKPFRIFFADNGSINRREYDIRNHCRECRTLRDTAAISIFGFIRIVRPFEKIVPIWYIGLSEFFFPKAVVLVFGIYIPVEREGIEEGDKKISYDRGIESFIVSFDKIAESVETFHYCFMMEDVKEGFDIAFGNEYCPTFLPFAVFLDGYGCVFVRCRLHDSVVLPSWSVCQHLFVKVPVEYLRQPIGHQSHDCFGGKVTVTANRTIDICTVAALLERWYDIRFWKTERTFASGGNFHDLPGKIGEDRIVTESSAHIACEAVNLFRSTAGMSETEFGRNHSLKQRIFFWDLLEIGFRRGAFLGIFEVEFRDGAQNPLFCNICGERIFHKIRPVEAAELICCLYGKENNFNSEHSSTDSCEQINTDPVQIYTFCPNSMKGNCDMSVHNIAGRIWKMQQTQQQ